LSDDVRSERSDRRDLDERRDHVENEMHRRTRAGSGERRMWEERKRKNSERKKSSTSRQEVKTKRR
jgi:hypothetical protein